MSQATVLNDNTTGYEGAPVTAPDLSNRDLRQRDLVPPARLADVHALAIGVGAIGRQVALQLAALGVPALTVMDDDRVGVENLAAQGYRPADLGQLKTTATLELVHQLNPAIATTDLPHRFRRSAFLASHGSAAGPLGTPSPNQLAVFCCVDAIETRRLIWQAVQSRAAFWADGRMAAEVIRVLASGQPASDTHYAGTLFAAGEAFAGSCTSKSTIYCANLAAGLMLAQFCRWLRALPVDRDLTLNLLAAELTVG